MSKTLTEKDLYFLRYRALYNHPRLRHLSAKERRELAKGLASQYEASISRRNAQFRCFIDPKLKELEISFAIEREKNKVPRTKRGWFGYEVRYLADVQHCYLLIGATRKHVYSVLTSG